MKTMATLMDNAPDIMAKHVDSLIPQLLDLATTDLHMVWNRSPPFFPPLAGTRK